MLHAASAEHGISLFVSVCAAGLQKGCMGDNGILKSSQIYRKVLSYMQATGQTESPVDGKEAPGDVCSILAGVSGGPDSMVMLHMLREYSRQTGTTLRVLHVHHGIRGEEADRDEAFVKNLCDRYDIPLHLGSGQVVPGKKGLEAAARDARYGFLRTLT